MCSPVAAGRSRSTTRALTRPAVPLRTSAGATDHCGGPVPLVPVPDQFRRADVAALAGHLHDPSPARRHFPLPTRRAGDAVPCTSPRCAPSCCAGCARPGSFRFATYLHLRHTSWHMGEIHYSRSRVPFTPTMSLLSQRNSLLTSAPRRRFVEQKVVCCESQAPSLSLLRRGSRRGVWRYRSCGHRPSKRRQRDPDKLVDGSLHRRTGQGLQRDGRSAREGNREGRSRQGRRSQGCRCGEGQSVRRTEGTGELVAH